MLVKAVVLASLFVSVYGAGLLDFEYCQHNGTMDCECDFGWTGPTCNQPVDFCNHTSIIRNGKVVNIHVCGAHGDCKNTATGANCTCDNGWYGTWCHRKHNSCEPDPCEGDSTCIDLENPGYYCLCEKWRTGKNCTDYIDLCHNLNIFHNNEEELNIHPCGDHGNCSMSPSGVFCLCDHGYTGPFCQHRIEYNCTVQGVVHPHLDVWKDRCNTCSCHFGITECEKGYWCPERCAVYSTPAVVASGLRVGCATFRENCVPDVVECARENDHCANPTGWCFPIGYVMLAQPTANPLD